MRTGFAALKYGATLVLMPFSFAYVPGLLLQGTTASIVHDAAAYLIGTLGIAMAIQGTNPFSGRTSAPYRVLLAAGGLILMFPAHLLIDGVGLVLLSGGLWPAIRSARSPRFDAPN